MWLNAYFVIFFTTAASSLNWFFTSRVFIHGAVLIKHCLCLLSYKTIQQLNSVGEDVFSVSAVTHECFILPDLALSSKWILLMTGEYDGNNNKQRNRAWRFYWLTIRDIYLKKPKSKWEWTLSNGYTPAWATFLSLSFPKISSDSMSDGALHFSGQQNSPSSGNLVWVPLSICLSCAAHNKSPERRGAERLWPIMPCCVLL